MTTVLISIWTKVFRTVSSLAAMLVLATSLISCGDGTKTASSSTGKKTFNLGYFPNVTHAQALIGIQRGDFVKELGDDWELKSTPFNAGPSAIEALFAGHLDATYIGPSPTINGYLKANGDVVRVIAGSADNGIVIVGNKKLEITTLEQLKGARIATPQLANTQDISAKHYVENVLKSKIGRGAGETQVIPTANPDIENLFIKDQIDAAWIPEPWASRLLDKGLVVVIAEEKDLWPSKRFTLTSLVARKAFLDQHPEAVEALLRAHVQITEELQASSETFVPQINDQIEALTGKRLPDQVLAASLERCSFVVDPDLNSLERFYQKGQDLGFYTKNKPFDVKQLVSDMLLMKVLAARGATKQQ